MEERKLTFEELSAVAGGQYDKDATFIETLVVKNGNLYNIRQCNEAVGRINAGQKILVHPTFSYCIDGPWLCIVRIDDQDYITEQDNIAYKF